MKKILSLVFLFLCVTLMGCMNEKEEKQANIYIPDGTPALALAKVLDEGFTYENIKTNFHIVQASEIAARVSQDSCDMAIMPTTAAVQLFQRGIELQLASVNVFGNLFITGTNELNSLEELKGKLVLTTGATTIQMVKYVLDGNQIPYEEAGEAIDGKVALSTVNDASDIIPQLKQAIIKGTELYGVLGEPQVTKAQSVVDGLKISVDLQAEYKKISSYEGYPQACLIVKKSFALENANYVKAFLDALEENESYLNENYTKLPEIFAKYESNLANMTFTLDTISRCNLRLERAKEVKASVETYVQALIKKDISADFFLES
ncbi:MAG: hypothetical protein K2N64_00950 [Anaeroplasmataceae bacterium]|nr:hypothetical protein [Anaeroplasmataceae bacterium]